MLVGQDSAQYVEKQRSSLRLRYWTHVLTRVMQLNPYIVAQLKLHNFVHSCVQLYTLSFKCRRFLALMSNQCKPSPTHNQTQQGPAFRL